jgi:hypothetical protein
MITRDQILNTYETENDTITTPGKFEGEPIYTPYFYELAMNGAGNIITANSVVFTLAKSDTDQFPSLKGFKNVELTVSPSGFVSVRPHNQRRNP